MADVIAARRSGSQSRLVTMAAGLRTVAVSVFAGLLCGMVALGIGSRLAMRIVALIAGDADLGKETDAGFTVGEISVGGTIFLALLGGAAGAFGGMLYAAMRQRLAWAGRWRGLAFGGLVLGIFGSPLIEGSNPDFAEFGIPMVNVAIFAALFVFFGILIAPVYDGVQRAVPAARGGAVTYTLALPQTAGMLLLVPATGIVLAALIAETGDAPKTLLIIGTFVYLLFVQQSPSLMRRFRPVATGAGRRSIIVSLAPLGPPLALGLALDIYELLAIF